MVGPCSGAMEILTSTSGLPAHRSSPRDGSCPDLQQARVCEAVPGARSASQGVCHLGHTGLPLRQHGTILPLPQQAAEGPAGGERAHSWLQNAKNPAAPCLPGAAGAPGTLHTASLPQAQAHGAAPALHPCPTHQAERTHLQVTWWQGCIREGDAGSRNRPGSLSSCLLKNLT